MRSQLKVTAIALAALCCVAAGAGAPGYKETTTVKGKVQFDLRGVWLLVAQAEVGSGSFKTFPQLLKVSTGKTGDLVMHLMDVRLPSEMVQAVKETDSNTTPWAPTPEDLAGLRTKWATLPPATKKDVAAGDVVYGEIDFVVATPERYPEVFPARDAKLLAETAFSFEVHEKYLSQLLPPNSQLAQLAFRKTIYSVRNTSPDFLEGQQMVGFVAGGPAGPVPLNFQGPFKMYRLAPVGGKKP